MSLRPVEMNRYLSAERLTADDFGIPFTMQPGEQVLDAPTQQGPWATMTYESWLKNRRSPELGVGKGQMYCRTEEGHLVGVAGFQE